MATFGVSSAGGTPTVLHVLEALEGGTARHVIDLVSHTHGFHHHVAVPPTRIGRPTATAASAQMTAAGAVVHPVPMARTPWHPLNAKALLGIRSVMRQVTPAVVHGHSSVGGALARLAAIGSDARSVYTPNAMSPHPLARVLERTLARRTDRIIAVSVSEAEQMVSWGVASRADIAVIANGIDPDEVPEPVGLRDRLSIPESAPIVGNISRLADQKDPLTFLQGSAVVAQARADVHFVLIGTGPLRSDVVAAIARLPHAERFHLVEDLQEGASGALRDFAVVVLSSRFEGGPYVPLEAMRAGIPVVAADAVGSRDAVADGHSGILFPIGDARRMADAVLSIISDPEMRAHMADAGRRRLRDHFDVRETARATGDLYRRLLDPLP